MALSNRLTYANVASTLALVVALGGGGAAVAAGLAKNSVGSPQLKAGAVKTDDLGGNAVTSGKVKDGALTGADVKSDSLTGADVDEDSLDLAATPRVASGVGLDEGVLSDGGEVIASVTMKAPAAGYVLVTGESTFLTEEDGGWIDASIVVDGQVERFTYWEGGDTDGNYDETNTMSVVVPVTAGAHTFALGVAEGGVSVFGTYYRPQVTAQYFPEGSAATQPPVEEPPI